MSTLDRGIHVSIYMALAATAAWMSAVERNRAISVSTVALAGGPGHESLDEVMTQLRGLARLPAEHDLIVTPMMPFLFFREDSSSSALDAFSAFARSQQSWLAVALSEGGVDGKTYWTSVLFDRSGERVGKYRKSHCLAGDANLARGDALPVFETDFGRIGLTIGTDIYFPEIYTMLSLRGADLVTWQHYPEPIRDHSTWRELLFIRAFDNKTPLITAHYADPHPYLAANASLGHKGSLWGRSQIINRIGVAVADTGYDVGSVNARLDLEATKQVYAHDADPRRSEGQFFVTNNGGRELFEMLSREIEVNPKVNYTKRKIRIAMVHSDRDGNWRGNAVPEVMLRQIDAAAKLEPDLVLLSEMQADIVNEAARHTLKEISRKADEMNAYIIMAGVDPTGDAGSVAWVWDREGEVVQQKPIYWPRGHSDSQILDTDFGRIGIHVCGDLHIQELDRILALQGAEIIFDPTMMWGPDGETNLRLAKGRAADNGVWLAVGHWNERVYRHRSWIVDPYGQTLVSSPYGVSDVLAYDIDLDNTRRWTAMEDRANPSKSPWADEWGALVERDEWRQMIFSNRRPELYEGIGSERPR